jgi:hypothetical protein
MVDNNTNSQEKSLSDQFKVIGRNEDSFIESYVAHGSVNESEFEFFVICEVLSDSETSDEIADSLVETFRKHFFEESSLDPYTRFEEALKFVNDVARDIQVNGVPLYQLNMAVAVLKDDILYLTQANDAEIYLIRGGVVSNISEGLSVGKRKEHSDLFENIATGNLEKGDVVLFSSARLIRYVSQNELGRFFHFKNLESGLSELDEAITTDVLGRVGVLGIKVEKALVEITQIENVVNIKPKSKDILANLNYYKARAHKGLKIANESLFEFRIFVSKFLSGKNVKIDSLKHKNTVIGLSVVVGIFFLYFVFTVTGILDSPSKKANMALLEESRTIIASAKSEPDRDRAAQLILSAESKINEASETKSLASEIEEVLVQLNEVKSVVDNLVVLNDLPVYADISQKRSDANIIGLKKLLNSYYAYDSKRMYEFIGGLVKDPVNLVDQGEVKSGASFLDSESLVYLTADNKIREYDTGVVKFMDTEDVDYKPASQILTYGSRLYLLDKTAGQIWKYQRRRDSYAKAEPTLNNVDIEKVKKATDFALDGSVYLLFADGTLEKYYAGSLVPDFEVSSKPLSPISSANSIFTDLDFPFVFVMDSSAKKLYQYYKEPQSETLNYLRQYYFEDLSELTGFIVDLPNRRILVSDKNKVYNTPLLN